MTVREIFKVNRQSVPAPDKLQVQTALLMRETFKDTPEARDDFVIVAAIRVLGDRFEKIHADFFGTTDSYFESLWGQVAQIAQFSLDYNIDAVTDRLDLLSAFAEPCLDYKTDEFIDVSTRDLT